MNFVTPCIISFLFTEIQFYISSFYVWRYYKGSEIVPITIGSQPGVLAYFCKNMHPQLC